MCALCEPDAQAQTVLAIRIASLADLQAIVVIEHDSFPTPWSTWMLRQEISDPRTVYLVAEVEGRVVGYGGMSVAGDEAHIGTLAVAPAHRGRGIGEALVLALLAHARQAGVRQVVLEYRVHNTAAERLYHKLGFRVTRVRPGYYQDTNEDGVEAVLEGLDTAGSQQRLAGLRRDWERRHGAPFPRI